MTATQCELPLSPARHIAPMQCTGIAASVGFRSEPPISEPSDEWHVRLRSLHELICELLIKNQRLRVALLEATSASPAESPAQAA
jgi:hypothetical protein